MRLICILVLLVLSSYVAAANLAVGIEGVPAGSARIAITNHAGVSAYITAPTELLDLPDGHYSLAAGPVQVGDDIFITPTGTSSFTLQSGATTEYTVKYLDVTGSSLYRRNPDFQYCEPGTPSTVGLRRAADEVNFFRALMGLPILGVIEELTAEMQAAAMLYAMNPAVETPHNPPLEAVCWSKPGADTAAVSNLSVVRSSADSVLTASPPEEHIRRWFIDQDVINLGHRRWLLDPFLPGVAFGYTQGYTAAGPFADPEHPFAVGASLQVTNLGANPAARAMSQPFVAYPYGEFPATAMPKEWPLFSFSLVVDNTSPQANASVDYSAAHITITDRLGRKVPITGVSASTASFGLPNHLQWRVDQLETGHTYTVSITNIWVKNQRVAFEYPVTLR